MNLRRPGSFVRLQYALTDFLRLNAAANTIRGSDHAHYDWITGDGDYVPINYDVAYLNGSRFVFVKVVNGSVIQEHSVDELERAIASPLLAAPYMWPYPVHSVSAVAQANAWYSVMKNYPGRIIALDAEETPGVTNPQGSDFKAIILEYWKLVPGQKFIIYSRDDYLRSNGFTDPFFAQFYIWLSRPGKYEPIVPPPWTRWNIWQDSWSGDPAMYGVGNGKKGVDTNLFSGTEQELAELFGGTVVPPPHGETMEITPKFEDGSKVRSAPVVDGTNENQVGTLVYGHFLDVSALSGTPGSEQWAKVTWNGASAYIAVWYQAKRYALLTGTLPPADDPVRTHTIEVFSDGTIAVDGDPRI